MVGMDKYDHLDRPEEPKVLAEAYPNKAAPAKPGFYWTRKTPDHGWAPGLWDLECWLIPGVEGKLNPASLPHLVVGPKLGPVSHESGIYLVKFHGLNDPLARGFIEGKSVVARYLKPTDGIGVWQVAFTDMHLLENAFDFIEVIEKLTVED